MSLFIKRQLFFKLFSLMVFLVCLALISSGYLSSATRAEPERQSQLPEVLIEPQPTSPLIILPSQVVSPEPHVYEILYNVTNVSNKNILAYTISQKIFVGEEVETRSTWIDLDLANKVLQPTQLIPESTVLQPFSKQTPSSFTLSVDFIEFTDGTTWGADSIKSAERIAGQRYGARESAKRLFKIFEEQGAKAVIDALDSSALDFAPPANHSAEWNRAFDEGKRLTKTRLRKAMESGGLIQVGRELLERMSKAREAR